MIRLTFEKQTMSTTDNIKTMKTYRIILLFIVLLCTVYACQEKDILQVDTSYTSLNILKGELNDVDTSSRYSFNAYFLGSGSGDHVMKIPVRLSGLIDYENDRIYAVGAHLEKTKNAVAGIHYSLASEQTFGKGLIQDSIVLTIHIGALSEEEDYTIWLELVPNENFQIGISKYQYIEINFMKNINTTPGFWSSNSEFRNYTYHPKKGAIFLQISKITDPNWKKPSNSSILDYWIAASIRWFEENEVYDEYNNRIYFDK